MSVGRNENCPCGSGRKYKKCCETSSSQQKMPRGLLALIGVIVALGGVGFIPALLDSKDAAPASLSRAQAATPAARATKSAAPLQASAVGAGAPSASPARAGKGEPPVPGATWSAAHGHWHRPGSKHEVATASPVSVKVDRGGPQPVETTKVGGSGGVVWSKEHGHWHKAAPAMDPVASLPATSALEKAKAAVAKPMMPTPDNPIGLRVGGKPVSMQTQPPGEAPAGKVWSPEHGHWHDAPSSTQSPQ